MQNEKIQTAVDALQDMMNAFTLDQNEFNGAASHMHRTLQNSFTKLCLGWIEYTASDNYKYDLRNESGHQICSEILQAFREVQRNKGYTDGWLEVMATPSGYCKMI